ncbi:MAG: ShlB/FhaC/HecB family hemolysin secretion/activation protein [Cyanobacteria bacterium P01_A01_bin.123]
MSCPLVTAMLPIGLLLLGLVNPAYSQVDPSVDPLPIPDPLPQDTPLDPPTIPLDPGQADDTTPIPVTQIQVVGSTVFSAADLADLVAPLENRTTTLAELQTLADAINQRYLDAGYITTQVRIPEQTLTDGIVTIEVLEGRLAAINVEGTERYQDYVTSRLNQASTDPLSQPEIEDQLQLLQLDPLFDDVEAELRQGDVPGESVLAVQLQEANPFSGRVFFDNQSPRSVGNLRAGTTLAYRSLITPGDALTAAASITTTGGAQAYALGYQVPVSPNNSTVRLGFTYEDFNITDRDNPAFVLGVRGDTQIYEAEYRHPLIRTPREELVLSLGFRHRDGESVILNTITTPSRTSVFQFGQDYLRRDGSGAWALRSQFNLGTGLLNATINSAPQADGLFFNWLGQVQRVQVLSPDNLLIVRADLQLSDDSLLGSEQFVIGGAQTVRGYSQNVRAGDSGFRLSIEDRIVLSRHPDGSPLFQLVPFTDLGAVWFSNSGTQPTQQNFLWGAGLGIILNPVPDLEARFDVGIPLVRLNEVTDLDTGTQIHFSLGYTF